MNEFNVLMSHRKWKCRRSGISEEKQIKEHKLESNNSYDRKEQDK